MTAFSFQPVSCFLEMNSHVTTPPSGRSLKCVARTARELDPGANESGGIGIFNEKLALQNNYFKSAEWYVGSVLLDSVADNA